MDVDEGRKRFLSSDELRHKLEPFVEVAKDIQHKSVVLYGLAKISKGIRHALHLAAELVDGEGTLGEGAELGIEEHGMILAVVQELLFKAEPHSLSGDAVTLVDDVQEIGGDGVEDPSDDHTVHVGPHRVVKAGGVTEDMVLHREVAKDEENVAAPLGVVGGLEVQNYRNQVPDVLDSSSLVVQVSNGCGVGGDGVVAVLGDVVAEGV